MWGFCQVFDGRGDRICTCGRFHDTTFPRWHIRLL